MSIEAIDSTIDNIDDSELFQFLYNDEYKGNKVCGWSNGQVFGASNKNISRECKRSGREDLVDDTEVKYLFAGAVFWDCCEFWGQGSMVWWIGKMEGGSKEHRDSGEENGCTQLIDVK